MRTTLFLLLLLPALANGQRLTYRWLNQPCAQVLNCDSGCTACNMPETEGALLVGTNLAKVGVDVCPHPVTVADNALYTYGWPAVPDDQHVLLLSGLVMQPVELDSVVIHHGRASDGPVLLHIGLSINGAPAITVAEELVVEGMGTTVLTDLGTVAAADGNAMGMYQLVLQPFQGQGGSWTLDEVRIAAGPAPVTGITELAPGSVPGAPRFDLLGRPAPRYDANGVFIDRYKRVRVR